MKHVFDYYFENSGLTKLKKEIFTLGFKFQKIYTEVDHNKDCAEITFIKDKTIITVGTDIYSNKVKTRLYINYILYWDKITVEDIPEIKAKLQQYLEIAKEEN